MTQMILNNEKMNG